MRQSRQVWTWPLRPLGDGAPLPEGPLGNRTSRLPSACHMGDRGETPRAVSRQIERHG